MLPDDFNGEQTVKTFPNPATQFKGQPGPGRPKGSRNRQTIVREALEAILAGSDQQVVDAMTAAAIAKAMTGDIPAFKELMDSGYGKIADKQLTASTTIEDILGDIDGTSADLPQGTPKE